MRKYLSFFKIGLQLPFIYRSKVWLRAVRHTVVALTFIVFWSAVLKGSADFSGFTLSTLITYYALVEIIDTLYTQTPGRVLAKDINSGNLSSYLVKPINYWGYTFSYTAGQQLAGNSLSFIFIIAAFLFFPSHLLLPTQLINGLFFVLSLIISFLLYFQIFFLVGSLTFFLSQTTFLRQGINQIAGVLGGKWIPIILMPVAAQSIIIYLPFRFLYDGPLKIFQEKMIQQDIILGLVTGSFWLLFFMILGRYVWGKGIKKYEAYGH